MQTTNPASPPQIEQVLRLTFLPARGTISATQQSRVRCAKAVSSPYPGKFTKKHLQGVSTMTHASRHPSNSGKSLIARRGWLALYILLTLFAARAPTVHAADEPEVSPSRVRLFLVPVPGGLSVSRQTMFINTGRTNIVLQHTKIIPLTITRNKHRYRTNIDGFEQETRCTGDKDSLTGI